MFDTLPAVSKIYYKDGPNDTVKGFDAVHVVDQGPDLELWLGEAKFYGSISSAIGSAVNSLAQLDQTDYLKDEFAAIVHKIDDQWPHADKLKHLLDRNTSLGDKVFVFRLHRGIAHVRQCGRRESSDRQDQPTSLRLPVSGSSITLRLSAGNSPADSRCICSSSRLRKRQIS